MGILPRSFYNIILGFLPDLALIKLCNLEVQPFSNSIQSSLERNQLTIFFYLLCLTYEELPSLTYKFIIFLALTYLLMSKYNVKHSFIVINVAIKLYLSLPTISLYFIVLSIKNG